MGREGLGAIAYASAHRAKSLNDLADDAGTNGTATLTDSETQALFHSDSGQQLNGHDNVIARHAHLGALGQVDDAGHVGGAEVELRTIVGEERSVTAAFFLGQDVDLALELGVGMDGTGLSQDLAALDLGAVHATQQGADVVAGLSEVQALAEHLQTSDGGGDALGTDANDLHLIANLGGAALDTAGSDGATAGNGHDILNRHQEVLVGQTVGSGDVLVDRVHQLVADMVLADDNFATIVGAVEEGRRIYANIRKAIQFLLASNMSEVLGVFCATLLGFTLLNPVHLLFINLITDCFPALALGMEQGEADIMKRKPRNSKDGIFAGGLGFDIAYQGLLISIITLASYIIGHCMEVGYFEMPRGVSDDGMTMAFLTMSMCEIFHSFNMRSQRKSVFTLHTHNKVLWGAMLGSLVLTTVVLEVPFVADLFGFTPVDLNEYLVALVLAFLVIPIVEIVKAIQRSIASSKAA